MFLTELVPFRGRRWLRFAGIGSESNQLELFFCTWHQLIAPTIDLYGPVLDLVKEPIFLFGIDVATNFWDEVFTDFSIELLSFLDSNGRRHPVNIFHVRHDE